ncbi:replication initiation factor [Neisseria sp. N95_16]|uniref:Replication initiation factor n=1 Tax=Neisseria brasiliensis TaxID=2666100 RepID=A0A7X2H0G7_9NEIS|nr:MULTISPECIES: replication initiation factor domain-containing protein [Neisseria]MRN39298.1 replication initiation factor [Neisseria brasiliensis]PJO09596.1 replication initiation factor [Neisseria sp. N95_16]
MVQEVFECYETYVLDSKGNLLGVPLRRGVSDSAFIDQISFSFHESAFWEKYGKRVSLLDDEDFVRAASMLCEEILGFGITKEAKGSGGRFYDRCWLMQSGDILYGRVHFGGQNQTMLIELTATGCGAAKSGWESRLYEFISSAPRAKITRVDVAKDFFAGEYNPNQAREDRNKGLFTCHHIKPKGECIGSDWEEEDESKMVNGKTYAVGSRESSKYVRIYEKGKQLGDKSSSWVRFEIEFKSKDIVIPFEVLQSPGEYFGGAYPICERFSDKATRVKANKEQAQISADRYLEWVQKQFGRAANGLKFIFPTLSKEELWDKIQPEHCLLPKCLTPEAYDCDFVKGQFIHNESKFEPKDDFDMVSYFQSLERELKESVRATYEERMYDKYARLPISFC